MIDYSEHQYKELLRFIENESQQFNERRDYVEYFLSMEHAASIEELIKKFDNLFKLLAIFCFGSNKLPRRWYFHKQWKDVYSQQAEQLLQYLNKTILDYYKRLKNPTISQVNSCIINLRDCNNIKVIQYSIINNSNSLDIISERDNFYKQNDLLDSLNKDCQDYIDQKAECKCNFRHLIYNGHILDVREIAFCNYHLIDYEKLLPFFERGKEIREKEEKELLEAKKRSKKRNMIRGIILIFVFILILFTLIYISEAIGGILGLILIIGLIGSIPKVLMTGKF